MRRLFAVVLLAACSLAVAAPAIAAFTANGRVVSCPAGDPLDNFTVYVWVNGVLQGSTNTNSAGQWSMSVTIPNCDTQSGWISASVGAVLPKPYTQNYCPGGCCIQVTKHVVGCDSSATLQDLQFKCNVPGFPACP